jgi:hypothetical protein
VSEAIDHQAKSCNGKMKYFSRAAAISFDPWMDPYLCTACNKWHLATPSGKSSVGTIEDALQLIARRIAAPQFAEKVREILPHVRHGAEYRIRIEHKGEGYSVSMYYEPHYQKKLRAAYKGLK